MRRIIIVLMLSLLMAGCGARAGSQPESGSEPVALPEVTVEPAATAEPLLASQPQPVVAAVDVQTCGGLPISPELALLRLANPDSLTTYALQDQLTQYLNVGEVAPGARLQELIELWYKEWKPQVLQGDINGDGQAEYAIAFRLFGEGRPVGGKGALFIIWRKDGRWQVDRSPGDDVPGAMLYDLADLTGDGRPELIWGSTEVGAHTAFYDVFVSTWAPGRLEQLPGKIHMASMQCG